MSFTWRREFGARQAARDAIDNPPGPSVLKAPILSAWLVGGAILFFALAYFAFEHVVFAAVCGVLGGLPQWVLGGAFVAALISAGFMLWLDGMTADLVTPAILCAPAGAIAGLVIRGVALLAGAGRKG